MRYRGIAYSSVSADAAGMIAPMPSPASSRNSASGQTLSTAPHKTVNKVKTATAAMATGRRP
ncbi:hypothetical protein AORI_6214 [Amycolatopsis keratiniphila]|uniref:Uncharacterized protein n=1 Tax=Amycolatopsis keratiniphila TaxID=129921 RepID=R4TDD8_9PSEU|nr:hypothetical protein [Amycolatopsis keratiniphila]AGM08797.1 hypothetical protein AORI_6214 [Amycolatopsis keratiniphila]